MEDVKIINKLIADIVNFCRGGFNGINAFAINLSLKGFCMALISMVFDSTSVSTLFATVDAVMPNFAANSA